MDAEKSCSSSFEDLSNINEQERAEMNQANKNDEHMDILGNKTLLKKVLREGPGSRPESRYIAVVNYTGRLDDGTVVEEERNLVVQIDDVEVVQGLDMALKLMNVGEQAEVIVNSRFGYGTLGLKNEEHPERSIPPNATITYTVELVSAKEESDLESKSYAQRKDIGNKKRLRGNFWMNRQEHNLAIQSYRRALEYLDESEGGITSPAASEVSEEPNADLQELLEGRMKVYNNLALAQYRIAAYDAALKSVNYVLQCQPDNAKALYRKGKILDARGETKEAITCMQSAATIDKEDKLIELELAKLFIKSKKEDRDERNLYQRMLGRAQSLEQKSKTPPASPSNETSKLSSLFQYKLWGYLMGSILIGVAGVAIYRYNNRYF
ncbi:peptidyl-prolyl cis-trans isomerase FKBP8 isoform X2 [Toxorhynchites rutilus septentrionalis]|uniref:peptidyl-prolyl cis-trans isomerase FKBP8 isoform X2 n=1 Tax=Toxorhynchites rutilus septentrionalis TaxID=329112 RepID=UPI0024788A91|nr:peptidyl-prolyl cis-trans isomerase FKBP8 isoform X2 [Toxorhynchites rutilus septentrionalis]